MSLNNTDSGNEENNISINEIGLYLFRYDNNYYI